MSLFCNFIKTVKKQCFFINDKLSARSRTGLNTLIYVCIDQGVFPDSMKHAEIVPIFKKREKMGKSNCRPVSMLSCLPKIFEKILITQMSEYFDDIFSPHISAFMKAHGCQDVLLHFTNNAKLSLDDRNVKTVVKTVKNVKTIKLKLCV